MYLELACVVMVYHWTRELMGWIDTHSDMAPLLKKMYAQSSLDTYISTLSQLQFLLYFKTFQCKQISTNKTNITCRKINDQFSTWCYIKILGKNWRVQIHLEEKLHYRYFHNTNFRMCIFFKISNIFACNKTQFCRKD